MSKRIAAIVLAVTFLSLAVAPETLAQRYRRDCNRSVNTRSYSSYPSRGVAGQRYYAQPYYGSTYSQPYYGNRSDYGQSYYRGRRNSTRNLVLTVAGPAAVGAGIGAITGGQKGAGVGALIGGGGGALFYLLKNRGRRR
jgi:hypothetical protein